MLALAAPVIAELHEHGLRVVIDPIYAPMTTKLKRRVAAVPRLHSTASWKRPDPAVILSKQPAHEVILMDRLVVLMRDPMATIKRSECPQSYLLCT
jgi:hypothetical protein